MIWYIIGSVLGVIVLILQNLNATSIGFRICSLLLTIAVIWSMSCQDVGFWYVILIPIGVICMCFLSAVLFPYSSSSARAEYMSVNGRDYYSELNDFDCIGEIKAPGLKQTYDRIISGIISGIVITQDDYQKLIKKIYSDNFYPISSSTKRVVLDHLTLAIEEVAIGSYHMSSILKNAEKEIGLLFNAFVCVMSIHEEATKRIEELKKRQI